MLVNQGAVAVRLWTGVDPDRQVDIYFRLGELYALVHRPADNPGIERILCVVPRGYHALPRADIWTNLLLTLAVEPERFFRVAILRGVRSRRP